MSSLVPHGSRHMFLDVRNIDMMTIQMPLKWDSGWILQVLKSWFCCYTTSIKDCRHYSPPSYLEQQFFKLAGTYNGISCPLILVLSIYLMNKLRLLIIWFAKACTWSWNHLNWLQRNAEDRFLLKSSSAERLVVERERQLRDIVVE